MYQYDKKVMNRVKRAEGQLRGILAMMEEEKECADVVTQLSAVRSSIDRVIGMVIAENLVQCVQNEEKTGRSKEESIQQAIELLIKSK